MAELTPDASEPEPETVTPEVVLEVAEAETTEAETAEVEVVEPEVLLEVIESETVEPETVEPETVEPETVEPETVEVEVADAETTSEVVEVEETTPTEIVEDVEVVEEEVVRVPDLQAIHGMLDAYFDARGAPPANDTAALVAKIEAEGATIEQVDALIAAGRSSYPDVSSTIGVLTEHDVDCFHVAYSSRYLLAVPADYNPAVPTPVIFVAYPAADLMTFEDARDSAIEGMNAFRVAGNDRGAIVVAPITTRGWSPIADSMIFSILSQLQRNYRIDPDAISVVGRGAGGNMAWRSAYTLSDHWAALAPVNGGYEAYVQDHRLRNLYGSRGLQAWSSYVSSTLKTINVDIADALANANLSWQARYFEAPTVAITPDVVAEIGDFLVAQRRDMWPRAVYLWGGSSMRYDTNWAGQTEEIYPDRAFRWNQKYWLEVTPNNAPGINIDISASVLDAHTIIITSSNARAVRVHLHPDMGIDFDRPLQIFANDLLRYDGPIHQDLAHLLTFVREWDDPGRRFHGYVDITIPTDRVVPAPFGQP